MNDTLAMKLQQGKTIVGSHVFGGMPMLTEAMAQCGFDVLWIDMEHTSIDHENLVNNLIASFPFDRTAASAIMESAGIGVNARAEELSIEEFCLLSNHITEALHK